jgi:tetratricopeptide (TPR) repeat protein
MNIDEQMFQEAKDAFEERDYQRCKDLLSRLIRDYPHEAELWVWLSAVVSSKKERTFCLKKALEIDPDYLPAKQGLTFSGEYVPDKSMLIPVAAQAQNWSVDINEEKIVQKSGGKAVRRRFRFSLGGLGPIIGALAVATIVIFFVLFPSRGRYVMSWFTGGTATPRPKPTLLPTAEPWSGLAETITRGPDPLWKSLSATYTPTPLYVNTPHPSTESYRSGLYAYERGEWDQVLLYMEQAKDVDPDSIDIDYYIGLATFHLGQNSKAIGIFDKIIAEHPDFAPARTAKAIVVLNMEAVSDSVAIDLLKNAIYYDPAYLDSYYELAKIRLSMDDPEQALAILSDAEQYANNSYLLPYLRAEAYFNMDKLDDALEQIKIAIEVDQTSTDAYRLMGQIYMQQENFELAQEPLEIAATYLTDDAEVFAWLGTIYASNGAFDSALSAFNKAENIDDSISEIYYQKGAVYFKQEQYENALIALEKGYNLNKEKFSFDGHILLGRTYLIMETPGKAYQQFSVAEGSAKSNKDWVTLYYWRAVSLDELGEVKYALRDRKALIAIERDEGYADMWDETRALLDVTFTATPTPITPSVTYTRMPTKTPRPTITRLPTQTSTTVR